MLAFVHIQKTAGTTLKFILRNTFGLRHCNLLPADADEVAKAEDIEFARRVHIFGLDCVSGHGLIRPTLHVGTDPDYFTILREPKKRCLSHFLHRKRAKIRLGGDITFQEFMTDEAMHDVQVRQIAGAPDLELAKKELESYFFVGLTEHFPESIVALNELSPLRLNLEYKRLHVTPNVEHKREVLDDPKAVALLEESNRLDQMLYDHVEREVFPAFLEKAGVELGSIDASQFERDDLTMRYWFNRWFQKGVYRRFAKWRRRRVRA